MPQCHSVEICLRYFTLTFSQELLQTDFYGKTLDDIRLVKIYEGFINKDK